LNEKRIQEVIAIEKQADEINQKAISEAGSIPLQAKQEAKAIIEKARQDAEKEAQSILVKAEAKDECDRILDEAQNSIAKSQTLAKQNFNRAVTYVISRVLDRE
jgi:vacuolar-type H+-ATPase subunit H